MRYSITLMRTQNKKTNKERYFKIVCDVPERISKSEYESLRYDSDGVSNLFTESNKTVYRHYTTIESEV